MPKIQARVDKKQLEALTRFVANGRENLNTWFPGTPNIVLFDLLLQALNELIEMRKNETVN